MNNINLKTITTEAMQKKVDKAFFKAPINLDAIRKRLANQNINIREVVPGDGSPFDLILVCEAKIKPNDENRLKDTIHCITGLGLIANHYVDCVMSNVEILCVESSAKIPTSQPIDV